MMKVPFWSFVKFKMSLILFLLVFVGSSARVPFERDVGNEGGWWSALQGGFRTEAFRGLVNFNGGDGKEIDSSDNGHNRLVTRSIDDNSLKGFAKILGDSDGHRIINNDQVKALACNWRIVLKAMQFIDWFKNIMSSIALRQLSQLESEYNISDGFITTGMGNVESIGSGMKTQVPQVFNSLSTESRREEKKINHRERRQEMAENTTISPMEDSEPCSQEPLPMNVSVYESLQQKSETQNRSRGHQFAHAFFEHLVKVEEFVLVEEDIRHINLSTIVHLGFLDRLRYAHEEIVYETLQTLPVTSSLEAERDDCLLRGSIRRLKQIHRIASLLVLSLPWSLEDVLSIRDNERIIDYVFRPMSRYLFNVPCRECYRKINGKCMEVFFCKHGTNIRRRLPPPYLMP